MTLLWLMACHRPPPPVPVAADPTVVLARAQDTKNLPPVANRFTIHIHTGEQDITAWGNLLVRPPHDFRIEIAGPIGPPALTVACNGTQVSAFLTGKRAFYQGENAEGALRALTGGGAGLAVVTSLLVGQLPAEIGAPAGAAAAPPYAWRWWWVAPDSARLSATLDMRTSRLTKVQAQDKTGRMLLDAELTHNDLTSRYPTRLAADLPTLYAAVQVDFGAWRPAEPTDAAFVISPPPGATLHPLPPG